MKKRVGSIQEERFSAFSTRAVKELYNPPLFFLISTLYRVCLRMGNGVSTKERSKEMPGKGEDGLEADRVAARLAEAFDAVLQTGASACVVAIKVTDRRDLDTAEPAKFCFADAADHVVARSVDHLFDIHSAGRALSRRRVRPMQKALFLAMELARIGKGRGRVRYGVVMLGVKPPTPSAL